MSEAIAQRHGPVEVGYLSYLGGIAARTIDALHDAFGHAFAAVTNSDIAGCFRHCGYATIEGAPL